MKTIDAIHAKTLLELRRELANAGAGGVIVPSGILGLLIEAYMERAALIVVNDQMEKQGAEIAPYWAHHMMAGVLRKWDCSRGSDTCRTSSRCITEYCHACYAKVWWESQHAHEAQAKRYRDGMPKKGVTK